MYISEVLEADMASGRWTRADIVIEIISASNAAYDRNTKSDTYHAMGIRELWLVDPAKREVEVRSFEAGNAVSYGTRDSLHSAVLPEISISVSSLFL